MMEKAEDRAKRFKAELKALLVKWDTEITIETEMVGWHEETSMACYLDGVYEDGECLAEYVEINFGSYIDGD